MLRGHYTVTEIRRRHLAEVQARDSSGAPVLARRDIQTVVLSAIHERDAAPAENIEIACVKPEASKEFELGKTYLVEFIPAASPT